MIAAIVLLFMSPDPLFGPDKAKHVAASFVKEIYDWKTKGRFSWRDIFWDGVGLALGAGAVWAGKKGGQF
ncbi:MAG: hypothetical protein ACP5QG_00180 [candidate division WOR-3 bacterium]